MAGCSNLDRQHIRRVLPYAVGLQLIHADLVWQGNKTRFVSERVAADEHAGEIRENVREAIKTGTLEEELWL